MMGTFFDIFFPNRYTYTPPQPIYVTLPESASMTTWTSEVRTMKPKTHYHAARPGRRWK